MLGTRTFQSAFQYWYAGDSHVAPTTKWRGVDVALSQKYEDLRDKYNNEYADQQQSHQKTDRQKEIWIDWDEFLGIVDKLKEEVADFKPGEWTAQQKQTYQEYLITLLYSHYPLRNDFITRVNNLGNPDEIKYHSCKVHAAFTCI